MLVYFRFFGSLELEQVPCWFVRGYYVDPCQYGTTLSRKRRFFVSSTQQEFFQSWSFSISLNPNKFVCWNQIVYLEESR